MRREILQYAAALVCTMAAFDKHEGLYPMPFDKYESDTDFPISPSDKLKLLSKELHEFTIKGVKIMATSKKDAIKKYNHHKK